LLREGQRLGGLVRVPFFVVFELLSPVVEVMGLLIMLTAFALGLMEGMQVLAFADMKRKATGSSKGVVKGVASPSKGMRPL
jgi:hypothetical protein